ncbi:GntR family transcriptional regulator [Roseateles sp. BYS180W]|uniref:GntR family transcriptional regulator n=1 Tax=Roseateles rivi TaxID=3299028 RepID=A0ABW7FT35_9BURK
MQHWSEKLPLYQQLAEHLLQNLLEGDPPEGEAMPSVRQLAHQHLINPLTVARALQLLDAQGLLENRRGQGWFVRQGARLRLLEQQRAAMLNTEWPQLRQRLARLGLGPQDLQWE